MCKKALTLWAVNKGYYEDVPVKKALAFEAAFLAYVRANHADVLTATDASGDLSADNEKVLAKAIESSDHMEDGNPRSEMTRLVPELAIALLAVCARPGLGRPGPCWG